MTEKAIFNDIEYFIDNCTEQNIDIPDYKYNMTFTKKGIIYFDNTELHKLTKKLSKSKCSERIFQKVLKSIL